jgi:hypothetical protein
MSYVNVELKTDVSEISISIIRVIVVNGHMSLNYIPLSKIHASFFCCTCYAAQSWSQIVWSPIWPGVPVVHYVVFFVACCFLCLPGIFLNFVHWSAQTMWRWDSIVCSVLTLPLCWHFMDEMLLLLLFSQVSPRSWLFWLELQSLRACSGCLSQCHILPLQTCPAGTNAVVIHAICALFQWIELPALYTLSTFKLNATGPWDS